MQGRYLIMFVLCALTFGICLWGCNSSSGDNVAETADDEVAAMIANGDTAAEAADRVLLVDTRPVADYFAGHITDALSVPYELIAENGEPLYTNGWDEISTTASDQIGDSWLAHLLVNQLANDFVSTYADHRIVFYGENGRKAAKIAMQIGYTDVSHLPETYEQWAADHAAYTAQHAAGVTAVDAGSRSLVFTGMINNVNYENVSTRATHHGITYKGGALAGSSFLWADIPPFLFQELMTGLGASPDGNMADGIYYGDMADWQSKYPDGQRIDFEVTWDGADRYYSLAELYDEQPSEFDPNPPEAFTRLGIEPRIGGTRDANLLWNPGCIFCFYACVCGITSNAMANEDTWFADGGIYDTLNAPEDPRNYYAGRYYPRADLMPGPGEAVIIRATVVADDVAEISVPDLYASITNGLTKPGANDRVLVVDTRSIDSYIEGHIADALNVPYYMVTEDGQPLYTNGWDEVSTTASDQIADSWLAHMLINQLVNDFVSTYQDSTILFYGDNSYQMTKAAEAVGYTNVSRLPVTYETWAATHPDDIDRYAPGVVSVNPEEGTLVFSGSVNTSNYANVSTRATHHGITYKGGALAGNSFLWADIPPYLFQELLRQMGANPEGNMADGIYYGDMADWQSKYPDGQRVDFAVTWDGAGRYYSLAELYDEQPSEFDPSPGDFTTLGIEPRIGGTRDANLLWNPGCIFCFYACVCGITSNANANEDTWFADGGIYDTLNAPEDERNYYAGRYYPKAGLMPAVGGTVHIRATIVE